MKYDERTIILLVLSLITHFSSAQPRSYLSVTGGVGSYINHNDGSLLNTYNPRGLGTNVGLLFGRSKVSGFGWEIGLVHRVVRYQNAGILFDANRTVLDTNDAHSHYRFVILPLWLTYSQPIAKSLKIGVKLGVYAGWKTYGFEILTSRLYPGMGYGFAEGSRFPSIDTYGGQVGLALDYKLTPQFGIGLEGILVHDASTLTHPTRIKIPNEFSGYKGRIFHFLLKYYL